MMTVLALALLLPAFPAAARKAVDPIEASFKKADGLIEKGEYDQARYALDEALAWLKAEDPRFVGYHERTGASWLQEGNVREARISFTEALKAVQRLKVVVDSGAKAYTGMGMCLRRENNDRYALKFFRKALQFRLDDGTKMFVEDQIREIQGEPPVPAQ